MLLNNNFTYCKSIVVEKFTIKERASPPVGDGRPMSLLNMSPPSGRWTSSVIVEYDKDDDSKLRLILLWM